MKPIMLIGIVLIVLGVVALDYQGVTYTSARNHRYRPIQATHEPRRHPVVPLWCMALAGGIVLVIVGAKK